jgi:Protein of unknown function (DUF3108).
MRNLHVLLLIIVLVLTTAHTHHSKEQKALRSAKNSAFTHGEQLRYRVHYGWINAASVTLSVDDKPTLIDGRETFKINAYGRTFKTFDWAFKVRDNFISYVDKKALPH